MALISQPNALESAFIQRDPTNAYYGQINISGSDLIIYHDYTGTLTADKVSVWASHYGIGSSSSSSLSSSYALNASYSTSASYAPGNPSISASYSTSASYAPPISHVEFGIITGSSFSGNPKTYNINYVNPFPNNIYIVSIMGEDARVWSAANRSTTGFTITSNSNTPLAGMVMWRVEG
jgi:hypothetical protein